MVDGDIYYCDVLFFTWVSKHEEEDLHAALGSFPFMGVCQTIIEDSFMGPCIFLLPTYGESFCLHPLTFFWQCIAPQEGKLFIELHILHWAKLYDGDSHFLCGLGKRCFSYMYVHLIHMINHVTRNNFPCILLKR